MYIIKLFIYVQSANIFDTWDIFPPFYGILNIFLELSSSTCQYSKFSRTSSSMEIKGEASNGEKIFPRFYMH